MSGLSISPGAALAIWGNETPLFKRYNYWNRLYKEHKREPDLTPVTDLQEALVLLYEGMNDGTRRFIATDAILPDQTRGPMIRIEIYGSGYTRDQFSKSYDFPIAPATLDELQRAGVLSGTKQWGYTDNKRLSLNEYSVDRILQEIRRYDEEHPPPNTFPKPTTTELHGPSPKPPQGGFVFCAWYSAVGTATRLERKSPCRMTFCTKWRPHFSST